MAARILLHFNAYGICRFLIIPFCRTRHRELIGSLRRFLLEDNLAPGYLHIFLILGVLTLAFYRNLAAGIRGELDCGFLAFLYNILGCLYGC